jgi:hypothetical protein
MGAIDVIRWLESPAGEAWSYEFHDTANKWGELGTIVPDCQSSDQASTNAMASELTGMDYAQIQ